jgi:hypothetical protein
MTFRFGRYFRSLREFFGSVMSPRKARRASKQAMQKRRSRLGMEALEDRTVPANIFVSLTGDDANDGLSIATAVRTWQRGVDVAATANDGDDTINIESGLYDAAVDGPVTIPNNANISNLRVLGGWNSTFTVQNAASTLTPQGVGVFDGVTVNGLNGVLMQRLQVVGSPRHGFAANGTTSLTLDLCSALNNVQSGFSGTNVLVDTTITGGFWQDNGAHGIAFAFATDINLAGLDASNNVNAGLLIFGGNNLTVTNSTFANNGNNGLDLTNLTGDLSLNGVTAFNNDGNNDGLGSGVFSFTAIVGNVTIENSTFGGAGNQRFGVLLFQVNGTVNLTDVTATDNLQGGVAILGNGANTASVTGGNFSNNAIDGLLLGNYDTATVDGATANGNGDDGIDIFGTATVEVSNVTANQNGDDGVDLQDMTTANLSFISANDNGDNGVEVFRFTLDGTVNLSDLTSSGNGSGFGASITGLDIVNLTLSAGNDIDEAFINGLQVDHSRNFVAQQPISYGTPSQLNIFLGGGNDFANVNDTSTATRIDGGDGDDNLQVSDSGANPVELNGDGGNDTFTIFVPGTGAITANGGLGSDTFLVVYDGLSDRTVAIHGGPVNGVDSDRLIALGNLGAAYSGAHNPINANDGALIYAGNGFTQTVNYTGLKPIDDLVVAASAVYNATDASETLSLANGPVVFGDQTLTFSSNPATFELINFANKGTVTLNGAGGADTITVDYTVVAAGLATLIVDTGAGDDTVNVRRTPAGVATNLTSSGGTDQVNITNGGSVQGINGVVNVSNPPFFTNILIDNSADNVGRNVTMNNATLSGLAPANINYVNADVTSITVNGGGGGNTFTVNSTIGGFGLGRTTTINAGSGNDAFINNGLALPNAVNNFNGQGGNDTFTFNVLSSSTVNIDGGTGNDTIVGTNNAQTWNITGADAGNAPGLVNNFAAVENLVGGAGADTFAFAAGGFLSGSVTGNAPGAFPGDNITMDLTGTVNPFLIVNGPGTGQIGATGRPTMSFTGIEDIDFVNGSVALTINADANDNVIDVFRDAMTNDLVVRVDGVEWFHGSIDGINTLTVNGLAGNDDLNVDYTGGSPIPVNGLFWNGGANGAVGDRLDLINGTVTTIIHTFANENDGTVNIDGRVITYTGLEPIGDNLNAANRIFNFQNTITNGTLTNNGAQTRIDSNQSELVDFNTPTNSLTVNLFTGNNTFSVLSLANGYDTPTNTINGNTGVDTINLAVAPVGTTWTLNGGAGNDIFNLGTPGNSVANLLGPIFINGNGNDAAPTLTQGVVCGPVTVNVTLPVGDTVNFNDQANAAGTYNLTANTVQRAGTSLITFAAVETINVNASVANNSAFNITGTAANATTRVTAPGLNHGINFAGTGTGSIGIFTFGSLANNLIVPATGAGSYTEFSTGANADTIQVTNTGANSALRINSEGGTDTITILATGAGSATEINGGTGNDVLILANGNLNPIQGAVCFNGGFDTDVPLQDSVTCGPVTVTTNTVLGDLVIFNDGANAAQTDYTLDNQSLLRTGHPGFFFNGVASVTLNAGTNPANNITVNNTTFGRTIINANDANVRVNGSGFSSLLYITQGAAANNIYVVTTGLLSFLEINSLGGDDTISIEGIGSFGGLRVPAGTGNDTIDVNSTGLGSASALFGEAGNDLVRVGSVVNQPPGSPGMTISLILGIICFDGGANLANPTSSLECGGVTNTLAVGDRLIVDDRDHPGDNAGNSVYEITTTSIRRFGDPQPVIYNNIETVVVNTGTSNDLITITGVNPNTTMIVNRDGANTGIDNITLQNTGDGSNTQLFGFAGRDIFNIQRTGANSIVEANGGDNNDLFRLGVNNSLGELLGLVCINGGGNDADTATDSVTCTDGAETFTVTVTAVLGDLIIADDSANGAATDYVLDNISLQRSGIPGVFFDAESIDLTLGTNAANTLVVNNTPSGRTQIVSNDAAVTINGTGFGSLTYLLTSNNANTVNVTTTGVQSFLEVNTQGGNDTINFTATGAQSGLRVLAGAGGDTINFRSTGALSVAVVNGEAGNDTLNVGSLANVPPGATANTVDLILGVICFDGGANEAAPTIDLTCGPQTNSLPVGDTLNFNDQGSATNNTYDITPTRVRRLGVPERVLRMNTETVRVNTGLGNDTITITGTVANTTLHVNEFGANTGIDTITLQGTGTGSNTRLWGAAGNDVFNIQATGAGSIVEANGGDNNDIFNIANGTMDTILGLVCVNGDANDANPVTTLTCGPVSLSNPTGDQLNYNDQNDADNNAYALNGFTLQRNAFQAVYATTIETVTLNAGTGNDTINVTGGANLNTFVNGGGGNDAITLLGNTATSNVTLNGNNGADVIQVNATTAGSVTRIDGGAGNDTIHIGNTTVGSRTLDPIQGVICVNGNTNDAAPTEVVCGVTVAIGDTLNFNDQDDATNNTYGINFDADADAPNFVDRGGAARVRYTNIERLFVHAGTGNDTIDLFGQSPANFASRVTLNGNAGNDTINIRATIAGTATEGNGGDGLDVFNVGSDPANPAASTLANINGVICVDGGANAGGPNNSLGVSCQDAAGNTITLSNTLTVGDILNVNDQGNAAGGTYTVTSSTVQRTGQALITYRTAATTVETVNLNTSEFNDTVNITSTDASVNTTVNTYGGIDAVTVTTTGTSSIVAINAGAGADSVTVLNTGAGASATSAAMVAVSGGTGADIIRQVANGTLSGVRFNGDDGQDQLFVENSTAGTIVELNGGADNDTFTLGTPTFLLDGLQGVTCVNGGDHNPAPIADVTRFGGSYAGQAPIPVGDRLVLNDQGQTGTTTATAFNYYATPDTFFRSPWNTVMDRMTGLMDGNLRAQTRFNGVESVDINTGSTTPTNRANMLRSLPANVLAQLRITITGTTTDAQLNTAFNRLPPEWQALLSVADRISVTGTGASTTWKINANGGDDIIDVLNVGVGSNLEVNGGDGNDCIRYTQDVSDVATNVIALNGGNGNDEFAFGSSAALRNVYIDGGDHTYTPDRGQGGDTLNYLVFTTGVQVRLDTGESSNITNADGERAVNLGSVENIIGGFGNDVLVGDSRDNRIEGRGGNDFIYGGNGDDVLIGDSNDNSITGDDTIIGAGGRDIIYGGPGRDALFGDYVRPFTQIAIENLIASLGLPNTQNGATGFNAFDIIYLDSCNDLSQARGKQVVDVGGTGLVSGRIRLVTKGTVRRMAPPPPLTPPTGLPSLVNVAGVIGPRLVSLPNIPGTFRPLVPFMVPKFNVTPTLNPIPLIDLPR